jgi:uncharacterized DUF497 family protein
MIFQWDQKNTAHIAEHGVSRDEAEFVIRHAKPPFPRKIPDGKSLVWGTTDEGEHLQVIFVILEDDRVEVQNMAFADLAAYMDGEEVVYVAHAMPLTENQKSQLRARSKKKGRR